MGAEAGRGSALAPSQVCARGLIGLPPAGLGGVYTLGQVKRLRFVGGGSGARSCRPSTRGPLARAGLERFKMEGDVEEEEEEGAGWSGCFFFPLFRCL